MKYNIESSLGDDGWRMPSLLSTTISTPQLTASSSSSSSSCWVLLTICFFKLNRAGRDQGESIIWTGGLHVIERWIWATVSGTLSYEKRTSRSDNVGISDINQYPQLFCRGGGPNPCKIFTSVTFLSLKVVNKSDDFYLLFIYCLLKTTLSLIPTIKISSFSWPSPSMFSNLPLGLIIGYWWTWWDARGTKDFLMTRIICNLDNDKM